MELTLNLEEQKILERLDVEALVLFGSQAQGLASERSDIDIGVLVPPYIAKDRSKRNKIYDVVYDMISPKPGRLIDIDIVFLRDAPMELQSHVAKYGVPLYERNLHVLGRFREYVMQMYADFSPLREEFHRAILARIA